MNKRIPSAACDLNRCLLMLSVWATSSIALANSHMELPKKLRDDLQQSVGFQATWHTYKGEPVSTCLELVGLSGKLEQEMISPVNGETRKAGEAGCLLIAYNPCAGEITWILDFLPVSDSGDYMDIEFADMQQAIVVVKPEKNDGSGKRYLYRYDLDTKSVAGITPYTRMEFAEALVEGERLWLVSAYGGKPGVQLKLDVASDGLALSLLDVLPCAPQISDNGREHFPTLSNWMISDGRPCCTAKEQVLCLDNGSWETVNVETEKPSLEDLATEQLKTLQLPRPTNEDRLRYIGEEALVQKYRDNWPTHQLANEFGPMQFRDGTIYFGINFYDGEGSSGLGGWGTCNLETGGMSVFHPRCMAMYSAKSIFVSPKNLWFGLTVNAEWGGVPRGLARINRETGYGKRFDIRQHIVSMCMWQGRMILLGTDSVYCLEGNEADVYDFVSDSAGKLTMTKPRHIRLEEILD